MLCNVFSLILFMGWGFFLKVKRCLTSPSNAKFFNKIIQLEILHVIANEIYTQGFNDKMTLCKEEARISHYFGF